MHSEQEFFIANAAETDEIERRLLFLFQNDLLPSLKGNILKIKMNRNYFKRRSIKMEYKILGWIYVLGFFSFMSYYVFLFSVQKSAANQKAWALTFILSVVMDFLLISTIMVLIMEVKYFI